MIKKNLKKKIMNKKLVNIICYIQELIRQKILVKNEINNFKQSKQSINKINFVLKI